MMIVYLVVVCLVVDNDSLFGGGCLAALCLVMIVCLVAMILCLVVTIVCLVAMIVVMIVCLMVMVQLKAKFSVN